MGIWVLSFEPGEGGSLVPDHHYGNVRDLLQDPPLLIVKTMGSNDFVPWIFQAIGGAPRVEPLWLVVGCKLRYSHFGLIIFVGEIPCRWASQTVSQWLKPLDTTDLCRQLFFPRWFCNIISPQKSRSRPVPQITMIFSDGFVWKCWVNIPNEIASHFSWRDFMISKTRLGTIRGTNQHFQTHPHDDSPVEWKKNDHNSGDLRKV